MTPQAGQESLMQEQIAALSNRISILEKDVSSEKALSAERHRQNREDVHNLRGSLQAGFERMTEGFSASIEKMSDRLADNLEKSLRPVLETQKEHSISIRGLEIKWARASGYAAAGALVGGIVFEVAKAAVEKGIH
jgi:hypothetical protein